MADSMQRAKSQANSVGRQRLRSASVPSSNDQDEPVLLFSIHQHSRRHMLVIWWRENGTQTTRQTARQTRLDSTDWLPYWPSNVQVIFFLGGGGNSRAWNKIMKLTAIFFVGFVGAIVTGVATSTRIQASPVSASELVFRANCCAKFN